MAEKIVIYQVFTRLFGSTKASPVPHGDRSENGCGTMADFTGRALAEVKALGATHIWYTGLIEHATQTDYSAYGIRPDHKSVVKGKAGSPYAIKDYYDIDPDLATSVPARMKEFHNLVKRTHQAGLKMIIDFVPNHVAREYGSDVCPPGVKDLGENDDSTLAFSPENNFYYVPGEALHTENCRPYGVADDGYSEYPARATGNDNFSAWPGVNDWYETVKLNYGVDYCAGRVTHFDPVPNTWHKMLHILLFWAEKGIDAFRCDMAEMVPVEFWGWAIPQVKEQYPGVDFIAEVYNPAEYRNYVHTGRFDYLYDKVGLYDTLRAVTCGYASASDITRCWQSVDDIRDHMLNFLENHDEQRLASDFFAGDGDRGRAALLVSACMGGNPMMVYFGQELGERGMDAEGFSGRDGRTTIFDYWTVDTVRRWRDGGKFGGRNLTEKEKDLRAFYTRVLNLCNEEVALREGAFYDLMYVNPPSADFSPRRTYAFLRRALHAKEVVLVAVNFSTEDCEVAINLPAHAFEFMHLGKQLAAPCTDLLTGETLEVDFTPEAPCLLTLPAYSGRVLKFKL